jgi:hypothetical protein
LTVVLRRTTDQAGKYLQEKYRNIFFAGFNRLKINLM